MEQQVLPLTSRFYARKYGKVKENRTRNTDNSSFADLAEKELLLN